MAVQVVVHATLEQRLATVEARVEATDMARRLNNFNNSERLRRLEDRVEAVRQGAEASLRDLEERVGLDLHEVSERLQALVLLTRERITTLTARVAELEEQVGQLVAVIRSHGL